MGYTTPLNPGKFWDTMVIFVGQPPVAFLYTTCEHHATEVIKNEGKRFRDDKRKVRAWMHFPTPQAATCSVCFQLERRADPETVHPVSRVNRPGGFL